MKKDKHNLLRHLLLVTSCLLLLVSILSACTCKKADDVATGSTSNSLDETAADTATGTKENTETGTETESDATLELPEERSIGSANVALGCPVITNGCKDGSNQNLTDGKSNTNYVSDEHEDFYSFEIVVDLTRPYPVNGIRLQNGNAKKVGKLTGFILSVSADGRTYNEVADQSALKDGQLLLDAVTDARYVKITATEVTKRSSDKYAISLSEMEVLSEITTYEKYCRDTDFGHTGRWEKWGPYGFDLDGVQRLEEYYPNALEETYAGISGYIYGAEPANTAPVSDVPFAVTSEEAVAVVSCEFVPDAYEAILRAEREGLLRILHYAQTGEPFRAWIWQTMKHEYENAEKQPDYRHFIKGKFGIIG